MAKYAYRDGTGWHPEIVDGEVADAGVFVTALALEANGNPRLVYSLDQFSGTDIVRQAVWNGSGWTIQPVASLAAGQEVLDVGLDLDSGNRPHVVYFESDARYTRVVHDDGEALIRTPLKELLAQLDPARFWQVHRAVIVNHHHIAAAVRIDEGTMQLTLRGRPEKLPVSRHFQPRFRGQ